MVTLDQIKLLESKISQAIDYFTKLTNENAQLKQQNDELRETILKLKDEKSRMDEGIASALGKFNQFENAIEKNILPSITLIPPQPASPSSAYIVDEDDDPDVVAIMNDDINEIDDDSDSEAVVQEITDDTYDDEAIVQEVDDDEDDTTNFSNEENDTEDSGEAELDIF